MSTLVAVLGMHRSGTSAVAGTLGAQGLELGPVSERNPFNPRGNREIPRIRKLHDKILARNGGSWWDPPREIKITAGQRERRDDILATIPGDLRAIKDPRMLVVLGLWRELEPAWIGVIRNPVAVCASLRRRAEARGKPTLDLDEWEALWRRYNQNLLAEHARSAFPIVDFDRASELDSQVRAALAFHGIKPPRSASFYDPELDTAGAESWRERVRSTESLELWERLSEHSAVAH